MGILDQTTDLLSLYRHHVGHTEIPIDYETWCAIAGIAAAVGDRVWMWSRGEKVNPSLYVMLLGPSGLGKDAAIRRLRCYLRLVEEVNMFSGIITAQRLVQLLAGPKVKKANSDKQYGKMFLVTPELTMTMEPGSPTTNFVRYLTGLWQEEEIEKSTISDGTSKVQRACINWLSGTTVDWLVNAMPRSAIEGGFLGRMIVVEAGYRLHVRLPDDDSEAMFPSDYHEVMEHIQKRYKRLASVEGEFQLTAEAREIYRQWYMNRPEPDDERLIPTWLRLPLVVKKLCMVFSLSEGHKLVGKRRHMIAARDLGEQTYMNSKTILRACAVSRDTEGLETVRNILMRSDAMKHSTLQRMVSGRGIDARKLASIIETLRAGKEITIYNFKKGKVYEWRKSKIGGRASAG